MEARMSIGQGQSSGLLWIITLSQFWLPAPFTAFTPLHSIPPPSSTSAAHPSAWLTSSVVQTTSLVTVSEHRMEKHPCADKVFIHIPPCQFLLPWDIFRKKNTSTRYIWWTVKHKINCCCQKCNFSRGCLHSEGLPFFFVSNKQILLKIRVQ